MKISDFLLKNSAPRIILGYHRILTKKEAHRDFIQNCMWTSTESFEKQIVWMKKIGEIVDLDRILDFSKNNKKPLFSITFDDGWLDNYTHALPILKRNNVPATIFLSTDAISTGKMFWPEELYFKTGLAIKQNKKKILRFISKFNKKKSYIHNKSVISLLNIFLEELKLLDKDERNSIINNYYHYINIAPEPVEGQVLTWENIKEMMEYDISFGSHTHTHMILEGANKNEILNELVKSKQIIEKQIGKECTFFCYPNARYNDSDHFLIKKAGYQYGITLNCSQLTIKNSLYYLPRYIVYEDISKSIGYIKLRFLRMPFY